MLPPPHLHASRPPPGRFPAASQLTSQLVPVPSYLLQAATTAATDATRGSAAKDAEIFGLQQALEVCCLLPTSTPPGHLPAASRPPPS